MKTPRKVELKLIKGGKKERKKRTWGYVLLIFGLLILFILAV